MLNFLNVYFGSFNHKICKELCWLQVKDDQCTERKVGWSQDCNCGLFSFEIITYDTQAVYLY